MLRGERPSRRMTSFARSQISSAFSSVRKSSIPKYSDSSICAQWYSGLPAANESAYANLRNFSWYEASPVIYFSSTPALRIRRHL